MFKSKSITITWHVTIITHQSLRGGYKKKKQARKLQATLVRNYDRLTVSLTGVKCRATNVAEKK